MTRSLSDFPRRHILETGDLCRSDIEHIFDLANGYVDLSRRRVKRSNLLDGRTMVTAFFEASTRTQSSFELAGKRLGADVVSMSVSTSSVTKGETLLDTTMTLNAMRPDILVVRHPCSGAVQLLSRKVGASVINAGDGAHEHPTQALLDALTLKRRLGDLEGRLIAICGDIANSRVARSDTELFTRLGARVRLIAPATLLPGGAREWGAETFTDIKAGLAGCDVVMALRLQAERMSGVQIPSEPEYFHFYGLDAEKLRHAKPGVLVMHPGPMNRGVEIDSALADDPDISLITEQVEMGVAIRMAVLDLLVSDRSDGGGE